MLTDQAPRRFPRSLSIVLHLFLASTSATAADVSFYRLRTPGDRADIAQASGLADGKLGDRDGLWTACDRNGEGSAGRIYFISRQTLATAEHRGRVVADAVITITAPKSGWETFTRAHRAISAEVLDDLRKRVEGGVASSDERRLDLEAVTIAPGIAPPHDPHLFVVAEEPHSTVLELALATGDGPELHADLVAAYGFTEPEDDQGWDRNDGIEGLTCAGKPGTFYFAEEGTRSHTDEKKPRLMFRNPRLGLITLRDARVEMEPAVTAALTTSVRTLRQGSMQTLNGLCITPRGMLLAVDRNGGWINLIDAHKHEARRLLNLYEPGANLRELLAHFPEQRTQPYVSIEGIAVDASGDLWMVDDPAMPEGWRASALIRVRGVPELAPTP